MSITLKVRLPSFLRPRQETTTVVPSAPARRATFSATLKDCMEDWVVEETPEAPRQLSSRRTAVQVHSSGVARAWSWLHARYKLTATKRLRVKETLPLGEKRFVALVCVEDREFLIGGGSSGVSLLAQLGSTQDQADRQLLGSLGRGDQE